MTLETDKDGDNPLYESVCCARGGFYPGCAFLKGALITLLTGIWDRGVDKDSDSEQPAGMPEWGYTHYCA